jgi:hypothetical protein
MQIRGRLSAYTDRSQASRWEIYLVALHSFRNHHRYLPTVEAAWRQVKKLGQERLAVVQPLAF